MNKDNVKNIDNIDSNEDTSIGRGNGWMGQTSPSGCPLKLIVMSASLDARGFSKYLVDILYTYTSQQDYIDAALITIFQRSGFPFVWFCFKFSSNGIPAINFVSSGNGHKLKPAREAKCRRTHQSVHNDPHETTHQMMVTFESNGVQPQSCMLQS